MLSVLNVTVAFYLAIIHSTESIILKKNKTIHHALLNANRECKMLTYKGRVGALWRNIQWSSAIFNGW